MNILHLFSIERNEGGRNQRRRRKAKAKEGEGTHIWPFPAPPTTKHISAVKLLHSYVSRGIISYQCYIMLTVGDVGDVVISVSFGCVGGPFSTRCPISVLIDVVRPVPVRGTSVHAMLVVVWNDVLPGRTWDQVQLHRRRPTQLLSFKLLGCHPSLPGRHHPQLLAAGCH